MPFSGEVQDLTKAGELISRWDYWLEHGGAKPPTPSEVFGWK